MKLLSLADLDGRWLDVESALDATVDVDPWCSGPDWVIPVHQGFGSGAEALLLETDGPPSSGYALLARYRLADGRSMIAGLDPLWGFASPLLGADVESTTEQLSGHLVTDGGWDVLVLPGMPSPEGPSSFTARVVRGLADLGTVRAGEGITRQLADLSGGYDAWLDRRASRFRRNLRKATERAREAGVSFVDLSTEVDVFDRLLEIERRSWKGADASGITSSDMGATYRAMVDRLRARDRLRIHVARRQNADIGYILGGVRAGRYRGLQLSYTTDAAELSVGHLLQDHQIRLLCATGEADTYDLGMDLDYKRRWADRAETSFTIMIDRNGADGAAGR
ncbi:MAG: GNAT family N-acetyltransferase [Acidimicrobiia bacterium]|nr:GNAT family N-acetyltransferase [Acidimicrobiia bacterium]